VTDQLPYADYVRIEIHAEGRTQVVEFRPDQGRKVRAQATVNEAPADELFLLAGPARRISDGVDVTLRVTGPTMTVAPSGVTPEGPRGA
jgi:hypothetical protein